MEATIMEKNVGAASLHTFNDYGYHFLDLLMTTCIQ